ncbi:MAG: hypothetical protein DI587_28485 [Variovorax paradoxus]|nr:MAG: hypothetical protein DI583_28485 [Variovorax paradoxus]PZQ04080.1 MAG: hypothetical protein DI587_28485 [Variovorax paradoxus]
MRILFSTLGYKPAWRLGGPVVVVSALAEALVQRGHEVTVYTTDSNLDEALDVPTDRAVNVEGVQVRYFRRRALVPKWTPQVAYLSKSVGYLYTPEMRMAMDRLVPSMDLVHAHMPFVYPTYAAGHAAIRHNKPLFYHQHGVFDPERLKFRSLKKNLYLRMFELPLLRRAQTLIALTEAERTSYQRLGVDTPVCIIPNGVVAQDYAGPADEAELQALGIHPAQQVVLFMGRLHPIKGADRLLSAFQTIANQFPDALLVLAGPDEFGIEQGFRACAQAAGLSQRIVFPGMVTGQRKRSLLRRADLFCLPSDAEGFSMAVLEAMASRCAVLLSPGCHFPQVEQAGAGTIVGSDTASLSAGLASLLSRPDSLKSMGLRGEQLVAQQFTWDQVADSMLEAYAEGIERHRHAKNMS